MGFWQQQCPCSDIAPLSKNISAAMLWQCGAMLESLSGHILCVLLLSFGHLGTVSFADFKGGEIFPSTIFPWAKFSPTPTPSPALVATPAPPALYDHDSSGIGVPKKWCQR